MPCAPIKTRTIATKIAAPEAAVPHRLVPIHRPIRRFYQPAELSTHRKASVA
jgi:hypothetical protein